MFRNIQNFRLGCSHSHNHRAKNHFGIGLFDALMTWWGRHDTIGIALKKVSSCECRWDLLEEVPMHFDESEIGEDGGELDDEDDEDDVDGSLSLLSELRVDLSSSSGSGPLRTFPVSESLGMVASMSEFFDSFC
ncbi:hypothetical protein ACHAXS_003753 [Conticribra weissflogii]